MLLVIGYALGVNIASGVGGVLAIFVLAALFGIAWSGISLFVALNTKNAETTLSVGLLPGWVQEVAKVNPFTYIAEAFQSLIIKGFVWTNIQNALIAILIVGALSLGASIMLFRRKIS